MDKYWGENDASVHFCEKPYKKSKYVAEFYNTISAIIYFLIGIFFSFTKIKKIGYTLTLLSLGTAILHGTQRYYGQILDECSMLFLSFFIIEELRRLQNKHTNYFILSTLIVLYLSSYNIFSIFFFTFTMCQFYIVYLVKKIINISNEISDIKLLLINSYLIILLLSTLCWFIDQFYCEKVQEYFLHAWWHIGTGISIFLGLLFLVI